MNLFLKKRLNLLLDKINTIHECQYGFIKGCSTVNGVRNIVERMADDLGRKELSLITMCDLLKVFDCLFHDLLISKFDFYGVCVRGTQLRLLQIAALVKSCHLLVKLCNLHTIRYI